MIYGSVCSGIEAATVAWHPLGWCASFLSEIEAFPRAVLAHHYPETPLHGDFTTIQANDYEPIDLLVGGTPCQDFSVAGQRAGLDGERGNLTLEYARLARRLRPHWMVWENVPGAFTLNDGHDFGAVLACFAGYPDGHIFATPRGGWQNAGIVPPARPDCYGLAWRVFDAQFAGVPQRRRRIFVVGYLGDWRRAAAVLFERQSLCRDSAPSREAGKVSPTIPSRSLGGGGLGTDFDCDGGLIEAFGGNNTSGPIDVATALNACHTASGRQDFETETFITYPVSPPITTNPYGDHESREGLLIASTLTASYGDGCGQDLKNDGMLIAHTLRGEGFDASEDGAGRGTPLVPVVFDTTQITSAANFSNPRPGDPCHPLAASAHPPAVAFNPQAGGKQTNLGYDPGSDTTGTLAVGQTPAVAGARVRRLTPRECERLQGFPDDYTRIPLRTMKRKPKAKHFSSHPDLYEENTDGTWTKFAADGPRYKALGNSMAVPVMRWIGERIAMVEALP